MTEREIFETFMCWMQMVVVQKAVSESETVVLYEDRHNRIGKFQTCGYEEFEAGAIFDNDGKIIEAYLDSHVYHSSKNYDAIWGKLYEMKKKGH